MTRFALAPDIHNLHRYVKWPEADILLVAGDITLGGSPREIEEFARWSCILPYKHIIIIAGNHDRLFQRHPDYARLLLLYNERMCYLQDSGLYVEGFWIYGLPGSRHSGMAGPLIWTSTAFEKSLQGFLQELTSC